jgi:hypothetical protein
MTEEFLNNGTVFIYRREAEETLKKIDSAMKLLEENRANQENPVYDALFEAKFLLQNALAD